MKLKLSDSKIVAELLNEIGTLLELKGESPFKSRAYFNAARTLGGLTNFEALILENQLAELPGFGKALTEKITELATTGHLKYLEELRSEFPATLFELFKISGLGPKKIKVLYEKLGISSLGELEYACKENRLLSLEGFGLKTQNNLLRSIQYFQKNQGSILFSEAWSTAQELQRKLESRLKIPVSIAGSLRRYQEIVHDIDLLIATDSPEPVMQVFQHLPQVEEVIASGDTKTSVRLKTGVQADLRVVNPEALPYALLYFTGSKEHNTLLRGIAKELGLKLNEYGLFREQEKIVCHSEAEIYRALGLHFIPPELREGFAEIEWFIKNEAPPLLEAKDLKGVFHVHSTWSDGSASIQAMAEKAKNMGFQYLGLSDHSQSAFYAKGLKPEDIQAQHAEIAGLNQQLKPFRILKGIESDILADGRLDYPEDILRQFDFVIASVHSRFKLDADQMTDRLIKALQNPYTTMLGHLTGRLLLGREGYTLHLEKIFAVAAQEQKWIEINCNPHRMDLDWRHLRRAAAMGVKFAINPDAHNLEGLDDLHYGILAARKGWVSKEMILNHLPLKELEKVLAR